MPLLSSQLALIPRRAWQENADSGAREPEGSFAAGDRPGCAPAGTRGGIFATCSNPSCGSGWLRLWRRQQTPVFEGGWCCSEECMAARVASALGREMDGWGSTGEAYRHRVPLGLVMLEQGWITHADLRAALAAQRAAGGGRLGRWLVRQRRVSEDLVTRALGLQWGCPVLGVELHTPEELTVLVPRLFVDAFEALPLRVAAGKILYLGFEDRLDPALALAVGRVTGLEVEGGLVPESAFRPAHARLLEARFPAVELVEATSEPALAAALAKAVERTRPVESRLARVHDCFWLRMWLHPQRGPLPELSSVQDWIGSAAAHWAGPRNAPPDSGARPSHGSSSSGSPGLMTQGGEPIGEAEGPGMSEIRTLIVDDSSVMRKIVERALRQAGLDLLVVHEASSGAEALELLRAKPVDLILSDINMPAMDGLELMRQIRAQNLAPGVPVVMITTESSEQHVKQAIQAGAQGYIRKPFTAEQVKARVLPLLRAA